MKKFLLFLWMMIILATAVTTAVAKQPSQDAVGDFTPADCFFETGVDALTPERLGFTCGYVTVPEQHANLDGSTIRLPVAIRKAETARPDPLFLAQGGPGGSAFELFSITAPGHPAAINRDIVIFNQRGTLFAEPDLMCEEGFDAVNRILESTDEEEAEAIAKQALDDCYERLTTTENINLSAYDSLENAADIDYIRQALGYESYNFYGVSYGTLLGLHLMGLQPEGLRAVVLDSVVPTQFNFSERVPQSENRAYDQLFAACAEIEGCTETYPNLEARITALYEALNENPVTVTLKDDESGETVKASLNGDALRSIMFQLFYVGDFYRIFPRLVDDLEAGDFRFIENVYPLFVFDRTLSEGMYLSVICAEDSDILIENVDLTGVRPFIANNVISDIENFLASCDKWNVEQLPASIDDPVQSDIPVLLLSGQFDPITPPSFASAAAETLPNSYNYVVRTASHGVAFGTTDTCAPNIMASFLNNPTAEPNSSCLESQSLNDVLPTDTVYVPILQEIGNLETSAVVQFVLMILFILGLLSVIVLWPVAFVIRKIRNKERAPLMNPQARRYGRVLVIFVAIFSVIFFGGFVFNTIQIITDNAYLLYSALPSSVRPFFFLIPLIFMMALAAIVLLVQSWRDASIAGRVYHVFLIICLLGLNITIVTLQLFTPLFG